MRTRIRHAVFLLSVTVWLLASSGGVCTCSDPARELLLLRLQLRPVPRRPRPPEINRALGSWGRAEDGLACRFVEVRVQGEQPYLAMQIRNFTDADRVLANELPMGRLSGSYSKFVEVRTGTVWTPVTHPLAGFSPSDESPGFGKRGWLRVPAQGVAQQRIVDFWVPTGGRSPIGPQGELGSALHVRGELRWFDWRQGYRKGNHRASCPPLVTRWVRWR